MRMHPLLACFTIATATAVATTGALEQSAFASRAGTRPAHADHDTHLSLKELAAAGIRAVGDAVPATYLSGALPLTFVVTGGPVLGSYLPPAMRHAELVARQRALAATRARAVARAVALAHARALAARRAHAARERHLQLLAAERRASEAAASARHHVYTPASGVWAELRACESGGNYAEDSGNGYYGAYQFLPSTWWSLGFSGMPEQASPAVQDQAARVLQQRQGWGAWPACSAELGL